MNDHGGDWDPEVATQQMAWRREWRHQLLVVGLVPVGALIGYLLFERPALDASLVAVAVLMIALLVAIRGLALTFIWWRRRRGSARVARSPLWELPSYRQRTRLVKALRRGAPIPPEVRPLAVRVARDLVRRRGLVWLYLGFAVYQGWSASVLDGWARWFSVLAMLCILSIAGYHVWLQDGMRSALARLESEPDEPGPQRP